MAAKIWKKGIYCIEGLWDHENIQDQSTACDLFVLEALQSEMLDTKGIKKMQKKIISDYGNLHKILDLRIVINDKLHFSRQRK
jgi:hypothetical protein